MVIYNIIHGAPGAEYYYACIQNKYSVCEFLLLGTYILLWYDVLVLSQNTHTMTL